MAKEIKNYPLPEEIEKQEKPDTLEEPLVAYVPSNFFIDREKRYSYADYLTWIDDKRRELYNGIVYELFSAPNSIHARITANVMTFIGWFVKKRKGKCNHCLLIARKRKVRQWNAL